MTLPTWAQASIARSSVDVRVALLGGFAPATVAGWPPVAPQRLLVTGEADALAAEELLRATLAKTVSPDAILAAGDDWVDAKVAWFNLDNGLGGKGRIRATQAAWDVPLIVASGAAPVTLGATTSSIVQSTGGVYFMQDPSAPAVTLNAGSSYKGTVRFLARLPGTSGNVSPGSITKAISLPGGVTIDTLGTQVLVTSARDAETSLQVVRRAVASWARRGAGWTLASFDYLIPTSDTEVTLWTVDTSNPYGPGTIGAWIATAAGLASPSNIANVTAALTARNVRVVGSAGVTVSSAAGHTLALSATIAGDGSNPTLAAEAKAAIEALGAAFPLGPATLTTDLARAVLLGASFRDTAGNPKPITIPTGSGSTTIAVPTIVGFGGAKDISALSISTDEVLAPAERLLLTATITVV